MITYYIMNFVQFIINYKSSKTVVPASIPSLNPSLNETPSHGHTQKYLLSNVSTGLSKLSMLYTEEGGSLASSVWLVLRCNGHEGQSS